MRAETFVVATTHHLLLVRPTGPPEIIHHGDGMYTGLTRHDDRLYVAARRTVADHDSTESRAAQRGCVLVFDRLLQLIGSIEPPFPMRDVHGMAAEHGRLWVTCSFDDMVAVRDLATGGWDRWYPSSDPAHRDQDINHINSVAVIDDRLAVLAHRWGDSEVWFFDIETRDLLEVWPLGYQAHDLFLQSGALATCSSGEGLLRGATGWALRTGGFPRGVARSDLTRAVGISPVLDRDDRPSATPLLRMFTADWRFTEDVRLPGAGMIQSVLLLPDGAPAEPFPPLRPDAGPHIADVPPVERWSVAQAIGPQLSGHGWHGHEGDLRWSAARRATLPVVINPGDTHLVLEALSYRPGPCVARVELNGNPIGSIEWPSPGSQERTWALSPPPPPDHDSGMAELAIIVDSLWPEPLAADDPRVPRALGVGLVSLRFTS